MTNVTVYMKADSQETGKKHEHNNVTVAVSDGRLRVAYDHSNIVVNYPLTSMEKWEMTT